MRKVLTLLVVVASFMIVGCAQKFENGSKQKTATINQRLAEMRSAAGEGQYVELSAVAGETGTVSSWYTVMPSAEAVKVGQDALLKNYKAVLSFDTSAIPAGAEINYVNLFFVPDSDEYVYMAENLQIDIAGALGFSGTKVLSAMDYSAIGAKKLTPLYWNAAVGGLALHVDGKTQEFIDLSPYFTNNRTQLRVSFAQNPENKLINFQGLLNEATGNRKFVMFVSWK